MLYLIDKHIYIFIFFYHVLLLTADSSLSILSFTLITHLEHFLSVMNKKKESKVENKNKIKIIINEKL